MKNIAKIGCSGKSADGHVRNSGCGKSGNGRLSKEHLRDLRNKIPIRGLIENELGVRCHTESGVFRFECPGCGSFNTSVMKNQNLARCFGCETNFNPIDMVITVRKTGFRQTADFLTDLLESGVSSKPAAAPARGPSGLASLSSVLSANQLSVLSYRSAEFTAHCLLFTDNDISFEKGEPAVPERKGDNPVRFPLPEETVKAVAAYVIGARPENA